MRKIICDTNIWYGLGNGEIKKPAGFELVAMWNNVMEIGYSHKGIKKRIDEKSVQLTAQAILEFSDVIINEPPFHFVAQTLLPELDLKPINLMPIISEIALNGLVDNSGFLNNKQAYDDFMKIKSDFQFNINADMKEFKRKLRETSQPDRKENFLLGILQDLNKFLRAEHNKYLQLEDKIDYDSTLKSLDVEFPILASTFESYFYLFSKQKQMRAQPNDYYDLLNLYYVNKDDLYWTKEKRFINLVEERFLFEI